jgi:alcohol dehydrogenase
VLDLTDGFGADALLECVGTKEAMETAFAIARPGAIVGRVGVPHGVNIDATGTFYRNVGMRGGPAPARHYQPELLEAVLDGQITQARSSTSRSTSTTSPTPTQPWTSAGRSRR